ncbi:3-oxoacyl-[acyl-carrier-protein] reductase FabG-like [Rhipicephalus sanguineus]|uniref:3-oxoacyl-[acyl-carrier-protein] reductase FabG-like n=1 Tax=Rhipicephalus sanguineus TaxID=34632 RepID=UPI001893D172|nr:3-oxoacyl-[acyl-carrier-protein] reductase FabG-like [Rhipicephalus sanguineus]
MPNLQGKVAFITGASSGIGEATALHFATLGCSLSITARSTAALERVAAQCKANGAPGVEVLVKTADVRNTEKVSAIIKETADHFGKIDIVVNCAGSARMSFVGKVSLEDFDDELNINLRAVFHITQEVLPYLIKTKGNIVNVSSIGTMRPVPAVSLSGISKAGVDKLTKISALEYAPYGIRVNAINPGPIETKMVFKDEMGPEMKKMIRHMMEASNVMGRLGTVEEAARAIAFLASDDASFITGHCLPVDGGSLLIGTLKGNIFTQAGMKQMPPQ